MSVVFEKLKNEAELSMTKHKSLIKELTQSKDDLKRLKEETL